MIGPDGLRRRGGKTDTIVDGPRVPRLADAKADHVANAHVHHHLRRRYHHGANIVKRMNARAGQPVVEPHGVRAGREGMRKGVCARRLLPDPLFQPVEIANTLFGQIAESVIAWPFWLRVIRLAICCGFPAMPSSSPYSRP